MTEKEFLRTYNLQSDRRMFFALLAWSFTFMAFIFVTFMAFIFVGQWAGMAGFWIGETNPLSGLLLGVGIWILAFVTTLRLFLVSVPEITALITINLFLKSTEQEPYRNLRPYPTGMHFKYPWEQVEPDNYINLRLITASVVEDYPSLDGPKIKTKWSFQYRARWWQLPTYIAVDQTTITSGLHDVGSGSLSAKIARTKAIECKTTQADIEKELQKKFEEKIGGSDPSAEGDEKTDEKEKTLEDLYGIDVVRVALADIDFDDKFQQVRTTEKVSDTLQEIAKKIQAGAKDDSISSKEALNVALIVNGDITKSVQEVEGQGGEALAALLMAMSRGGK